MRRAAPRLLGRLTAQTIGSGESGRVILESTIPSTPNGDGTRTIAVQSRPLTPLQARFVAGHIAAAADLAEERHAPRGLFEVLGAEQRRDAIDRAVLRDYVTLSPDGELHRLLEAIETALQRAPAPATTTRLLQQAGHHLRALAACAKAILDTTEPRDPAC